MVNSEEAASGVCPKEDLSRQGTSLAGPLAVALGKPEGGRLLAVNDAFVRFSGWSAEEAVGRTCLELGLWQTVGQQQKYTELLLRNRLIYGVETTVRKKSGKRVAAVWSAELIGSEAEEHMIQAWLDISEYGKQETLLNLRSDKSRLVLEDLSEGVFVIQDWAFQSLNRRGADLLALPADQAQNRFVLDFFHPLEQDRIRAKLTRILKGGVATDCEEHRIIDSSGRVKWVELRCIRGDWNERPALVVFANDITRRKGVEEELWRKNHILNSIFEGSTDCIWIRDLGGYYRMVSASLAEYLKLSPEQVVGKRPSEIFAVEEARGFLESDRIVASTGKRKTTESQMTVQGQVYTFLVSRAPYRDRWGNIVGVIGISRDISERKTAEDRLRFYRDRLRSLSMELELAEEMERRKIATDLHDNIGQNLTLAAIKLDALQKTAPLEGLDQPLSQIRNLLNRSIQGIRSSTFELSPPSLHHFGLKAALEELSERVCQERNQRVVLKDDGMPKPLDDVFRDVLYRAVRELLVNVFKHAGTDWAEVDLTRTGTHCRVAVRDEGAGFDLKEEKEGFGLFSIRERMDFLGGRMEIKSKPGHGTEVTLIVPLLNKSGEEV